MLLGAPRELMHRRHLGQHFLAAAAHRVVQPRRQHSGQVLIERANRLADRHVVVVEDHQQIGAADAGVVQCLEGHARAHCPIADHGDRAAILALQFRRNGHAQCGGDRRRRVRRAKGVVFAFDAARKTRGPAELAQPGHGFAPAGQNLVRVGLVANVPHDAIDRRIEHVVQRHGEFDGAQVRRQVSTGLRNGSKQERAQFAGDVAQFAAVECAQVRRLADLVEQWIHGCGHQ